MTKIALVGDRISGNFGFPSILGGLMEVLHRSVPDGEYVLFVPWSSLDADLPYAKKYGLRILPIGNYWYLLAIGLIKRFCGFSIGPNKYRRIVDALSECEALIDFNGIIFEESLGSNSFYRCLARWLRFPLGRLLGLKCIKNTADIGPLKSHWNRFFGKVYMGKCMDLIFARSAVSESNVRELGVKTPVRVLPDTAFLLPSAPEGLAGVALELPPHKQVVGISVSFQIYRRLKMKYVRAIALLVSEIIAQPGIVVILIPNDTCYGPVNDRVVGNMIMEEVNSKQVLLLESQDLSAEQIKGVISCCEVMVSSRYHSVIAGLSAEVPTLVLGWHHKYAAVLKFFDMEEWLIEVEDCSFDLLRDKYIRLWQQREELRSALQNQLPEIRKSVYLGGNLIRVLLTAIDQPVAQSPGNSDD